MNYWVPKWGQWGYGLDDSTMPWHIDYDWAQMFSYDVKTKEFKQEWWEGFKGKNGDLPNEDRWYISNGYGYPGTTFMKSHVKIHNNKLRITIDKSKK